MRKFNINVDGKNFVVEVEEVGGAVTSAPVMASAPVVAAPVKAAQVSVGAGDPVKSPMPGTLTELSVANGAAVKKGDTVCLLEAMKMENPISAPKDGVVNFAVAKGSAVQSGDVLFTIA